MWDYNKEDLVEEVKIGGNFLNKSGCYDMTILSAEAKKTTNGADQVVFKFKTKDESTVNIFFIYTNREGKPTDFKVRQLNQLCGLLKVTPDKIEAMVGKEIGVFLKTKGTSKDGRYINWNVDGFYDTKTKGTSSEINKKEGVGNTYEKAGERYAKEEAVVTNSNSHKTTEASAKTDISDEDFPF